MNTTTQGLCNNMPREPPQEALQRCSRCRSEDPSCPWCSRGSEDAALPHNWATATGDVAMALLMDRRQQEPQEMAPGGKERRAADVALGKHSPPSPGSEGAKRSYVQRNQAGEAAGGQRGSFPVPGAPLPVAAPAAEKRFLLRQGFLSCD